MRTRKKIIPLALPDYKIAPKTLTKRWATRVPAGHIRINPTNGHLILSQSFRELVATFPRLSVGIESDTNRVFFWFDKKGLMGYQANEISNTIRTEYCGDLIDALKEYLQISKDAPNDFQLTLYEGDVKSGVVYTTPFNKTTLF